MGTLRPGTLVSYLADHSRATAESIHLDTHSLDHAHEQVRQRPVVLALEGDVPGVAEAAAGEQDRQVVARVGRGVAHIAAVEHDGLLEQAEAAFAGILEP